MKQNITVEDLLELTEDQKQNLRKLWLPKERDMAVAFICSNAETDEYEAIEFTVGRVDCDGEYNPYKRALNITLRSLRLVDESFYEELEQLDDEVEEIEFDYQTPEDYFNYQYCLPLLSIGQLLEALQKTLLTNTDFYISYNREEGKYQVGEGVPDYRDQYFEEDSQELCNILWNALKSTL